MEQKKNLHLKIFLAGCFSASDQIWSWERELVKPSALCFSLRKNK